MTSALAFKLSTLPESPGCYIMKSQGDIIYVGKAVNLKNRVRQYFHSPKGLTDKVLAMVSKVDDIELVLVTNELEALILECNLIKQHRPRYNILLKDDKQYPYLRLDIQEDFPRVTMVRHMERDGARYLGPYPSSTIVREVLDALRGIFPLRTCTRVIRADKPQRPCVHAEIGQCLAPCAGQVTREQYHEVVRDVLSFLSGRYDEVLDGLKARMAEAAQKLQFERAALYRDRVQSVLKIMEKQKAVSTGLEDRDVLAAQFDGPDALVQAMFIRGGKLLGSQQFTLNNAQDERESDVLRGFMLQYYDEATPPREILVSEMPENAEAISRWLSEKRGGKVTLLRPQRGAKKEVLALAVKNMAEAAQKNALLAARSHARTRGALEELARALSLPEPPARIEGFDISNTQGNQSVASMVVSVNGLAANHEYRRFRIKTVVGANDFASMAETVGRRFRHAREERERLTAEGKPMTEGKFSVLPDLVLIDGGPGQLSAALGAMREQGYDIPMFGLAERIDEIYLPNAEETLYLPRHSEALHLIQRLRDEAHRFAITYHRNLRGKSSVKSQLEDLPGIGPARRKALLKHFSSIEKLKAATPEELLKAPGMTRPAADTVYAHFHSSGGNEPTRTAGPED